MEYTFMNKHLSTNIATVKGHLNQERQHLQSTKENTNQVFIDDTATIAARIKKLKDNAPPSQSLTDTILQDIEQDAFPLSDTPNIKTNDVVYKIEPITPTNKAYTDLTGRFPYRSSRGNEYILVGYHFDGNAILAVALKNRTAGAITDAWTTLDETFTQCGMQPRTYVLDNEISKEIKEAMRKKKITFQLVPPHSHRTNLAERAIQTFKNHFKAGLASLDPDFPLAE